ncbi:hypothetical protein YB2330_005544 [Saitoella coloradoensis]
MKLEFRVVGVVLEEPAPAVEGEQVNAQVAENDTAGEGITVEQDAALSNEPIAGASEDDPAQAADDTTVAPVPATNETEERVGEPEVQANLETERPLEELQPQPEPEPEPEPQSSQIQAPSREPEEPPKSKYAHLPKPRYRILPPFRPIEKHVDQAMARAGYQESPFFTRPTDGYIRSIEHYIPESQLSDRVEYDMDEQDEQWLMDYNTDRKKTEGDEISPEVFEITLTKIEKEWTKLDQQIPKKEDEEGDAEDQRCSICDDGEGTHDNQIVFCDGCNLVVHQECYGVPYIPEGQWLCRKCQITANANVNCLFCPVHGGAYKQTKENEWGHLLCALFIPELSLGNQVLMEPVEGVDKIAKARWKLTCTICRQKVGACIQCSNKACFDAFHVTCARKAGLFLDMKKHAGHFEKHLLKAACLRHSPEGFNDATNAYEKFCEARRWFEEHPYNSYENLSSESSEPSTPVAGKLIINTQKGVARVTKPFTVNAPIIPQYVFNQVLAYMQKFTIRKKTSFVAEMCKYWSLKRESKKGANLLKRLQIQMDNATSSRKLSEEQQKKKLDFAMALHKGLETLITIIGKVNEREEIKLECTEMAQEFMQIAYFPTVPLVGSIIDRAETLDREDMFTSLVNETDAPDYYTIVKDPIATSMVRERLLKGQYLTVSDFEEALNRVYDNAMLYNAKKTTYYATAQRIKRTVAPLIAEAKQKEACLDLEPETGMVPDLSKFAPMGMSIAEEEQWPGDMFREMSPLSEMGEEDMTKLDIDIKEFEEAERKWEEHKALLALSPNSRRKRKADDMGAGQLSDYAPERSTRRVRGA